MDVGGRDAAPSLRAGATRGFLFADLRGYTALLERRGARDGAQLLERYRRLVRASVAEHEGAEIRTEGDSFYVVFPDASAAVGCGLSIVAAADLETAADPQLPIQVGVGVHAGETIETTEGYVGAAVNLAARLCAAAAAGEVLVSDTVRALTGGIAPVRYEPAGRRRLKGIADAVSVYRAVPLDRPIARGRRLLGRPRPDRLLGTVAAVGALLGTSLVIATVIREGAGQVAASPSGVAAVAPSAAPDAPASAVGASASADASDAREAELLALVDESYRILCETAPPGSLPQYVGPGPRGVGDPATEVRRDPVFSAGIICEPFRSEDPDTVGYWIVADIWIEGGAEELIVNRAGVISAPSGMCADDRRAIERWSAGPISGHLLCFRTEGGAFIYWTYDGADVIGSASRSDGDLDALLRWWNEEARYEQP